MKNNGIYARDSYLKATIFIGSDMCMLFIGISLTVLSVIYDVKKKDKRSRLLLVSVLAWVLYYAAVPCFGVTYNVLFMAYTAIFVCTLFTFVTGIYRISGEHFDVPNILSGKPYTGFLVLSGISTIITWLPEIISSFGSGRLQLIEVYTTTITYILDTGIISPTIFICLYLLKKRNSFGVVLLSVLLIGIIVVGILMIFQTAVQLVSGVDLPIPVIITKSEIFTLLGIYAAILAAKLYKTIEEVE